MISNECAKLLLQIKSEKFDQIKDMDTFNYLENCGYVEYRKGNIATISPLGQEVLDEYIYQQDIKNATTIANKKSKIANIISFISVSISLISLIFAIISFFWTKKQL